jgi:hypothetical protein
MFYEKAKNRLGMNIGHAGNIVSLPKLQVDLGLQEAGRRGDPVAGGWVLWSPTLAGRRGSPRRTARMGHPVHLYK